MKAKAIRMIFPTLTLILGVAATACAGGAFFSDRPGICLAKMLERCRRRM